MSTRDQPVRVDVGTLRIVARSAIEARRLADALPAAIERALAPASPPAPTSAHRGPITHRADLVAAEVARAVATALETSGGSR